MTSIDASWSIDKKIPSELDAGHAVIEELMTALEALGWEGRDVFHIQMAIEEAVVNAIEHGNMRDESKQVHVVFHVNRERAELSVTDQGQGFDHKNVADPTEDDRIDQPRGRGVMLIRELMTESNYNEVGNGVRMLKLRSQPEEAVAES
ncbi:MAG: ATP-binding protein [Planctomycetes bacterium]|nr:ATP-binding protein [Planctomycetota bacterium]